MKKVNILNTTLAFLAFGGYLILGGCGKSNPEPDSVTNQDKSVTNQNKEEGVKTGEKENEEKAQESQDAILARVDDSVLTVGGFEKVADMRCSLAKLRSKRFTKKQEKSLRNQLKRTAAEFFVRQALLLKYAKNNNISLAEEELAAYREKAAKAHKSATFEKMRESIPAEQVPLLISELDKAAIAEAAENYIKSFAETNVTEETIAKVYARVAEWNDIAAKTNTLVYARATNVYERIMSNQLTFEEAVEDYSEADDISDGGTWNEFLLSDLQSMEPALAELVQTMQPGEITPPMENDNGLAIIKFVALVNNKSNETRYKIARVFFQLPLFMDVPERQELINNIIEVNQDQKLNNTLKELRDSSDVEIPTVPKSRKR